MFIFSTHTTLIKKTIWTACCLLILFGPSVSANNSYNVTASIPFTIPSTASQVTTPSAGSIVQTSSSTIQGTCEQTSPAAIVSIWKGNFLLGSSVCTQSGNFSLTISLVIGLNELTLKTSNANIQYGPESVYTLTYTPSATPQPRSPTRDRTPSTVQPDAPSREQDLSLTSTDTFKTFTDNNMITLSFTVLGGKAPYTLVILWGDGAVTTKELSNAGTYEFTHTYDEEATYTISAKLTDILGESRTFEYAVVSIKAPNPGSTTIEPQAKQFIQDTSEIPARWLFYPLLILCLSFVFIVLFMLGRIYQRRIDAYAAGKKRHLKKKKPA